MRRMLVLLFMLSATCSFSLPAQAPKSPFMSAGFIQHHGTTATLTANFPGPIVQAVEAVSREYGWIVDFEDPPFNSHLDLVDATDPVWRASHPDSKGATRVAGGLFQSTFPEPTAITSGDAEEQVLQKVVADYNASGNPGKFVVRKEAAARYAVVGISRRNDAGRDEAVDVLLDTPITITLEQRDAAATLQLIADTLTATTGVKVYLGTIGLSSNPLSEATLTIGGTNVAARTLLLQAVDDIQKHAPHFSGILVWNLLFDADRNAYDLRLSSAKKFETNADGSRVPQAIRPARDN